MICCRVRVQTSHVTFYNVVLHSYVLHPSFPLPFPNLLYLSPPPRLHFIIFCLRASQARYCPAGMQKNLFARQRLSGAGRLGWGRGGTSWGQQGGGRRRDRHSGFPRRPKFACLPFDGGHKAKFSVRGMLEVTGGTEKIDNVNTGCDHVLVNFLSLL